MACLIGISEPVNLQLKLHAHKTTLTDIQHLPISHFQVLFFVNQSLHQTLPLPYLANFFVCPDSVSEFLVN